MCVKYKDIHLFNLLNNYYMGYGREVVDSDEKVETQRSELLSHARTEQVLDFLLLSWPFSRCYSASLYP